LLNKHQHTQWIVDGKCGTAVCDSNRQKDLTASSYRKCDSNWLFLQRAVRTTGFPILLIVVVPLLLAVA
jgi:hypothetical protein